MPAIPEQTCGMPVQPTPLIGLYIHAVHVITQVPCRELRIAVAPLPCLLQAGSGLRNRAMGMKTRPKGVIDRVRNRTRKQC